MAGFFGGEGGLGGPRLPPSRPSIGPKKARDPSPAEERVPAGLGGRRDDHLPPLRTKIRGERCGGPVPMTLRAITGAPQQRPPTPRRAILGSRRPPSPTPPDARAVTRRRDAGKRERVGRPSAETLADDALQCLYFSRWTVRNRFGC